MTASLYQSVSRGGAGASGGEGGAGVCGTGVRSTGAFIELNTPGES